MTKDKRATSPSSSQDARAKVKRGRKGRSWFGVALFIVISAATIAIAMAIALPPAVRGRTTVRIATSKNLWCGLTLLANELGYFRDEGLNATLTYQAAGRLNMEALMADAADAGNIVEVNLANLGLNGGRQLQVVASIVAARDFSIVARKSAGIKSRGDLRGRTIAFAGGTGAEMYARALQQQQGWTAKDVAFRKVQPTALQPSVLTGDVQAAAVWEPFAYNITRALGNDAFILRDPSVYEGVMNLAVRTDWADRHPADVVALVKALAHAEEFVRVNPDSARRVLARLTQLDTATVGAIWPYFSFRVNMDTAAQVRLTRHVAEVLLQADSGATHTTIPDYAQYFDARYFALAVRNR